MTFTAVHTMMSARPKGLLKIPVGKRQKRVRAVLFVAGAGATLPSSVGRLIGAASPPSTGTATLATALFSSRSQLAAHAGFAF